MTKEQQKEANVGKMVKKCVSQKSKFSILLELSNGQHWIVIIYYAHPGNDRVQEWIVRYHTFVCMTSSVLTFC